MTVTVADVMRHVRNYFVSERYTGQWEIAGGTLLPRDILPLDSWIAIPAPCPNPGVWQLVGDYGLPGVPGSEWEGDILVLNPPADFIRLCKEIAQWAEIHSDPSLAGEKFSLYSSQLRDGRWQTVFDAALRPYMKMYPEIEV